MEPSANLGMPAIIGGVLALIVVALIIARIVRPRGPRPAPPRTTPLPPHTDAAFLDSSHIIGNETKESAAPGAEGDARKLPRNDSKP